MQELVAILGGVLGFWGGVRHHHGHCHDHDHHNHGTDHHDDNHHYHLCKGWFNGRPLPACPDDPEVLLQAQGGQERGADADNEDVGDDDYDVENLQL